MPSELPPELTQELREAISRQIDEAIQDAMVSSMYYGRGTVRMQPSSEPLTLETLARAKRLLLDAMPDHSGPTGALSDLPPAVPARRRGIRYIYPFTIKPDYEEPDWDTQGMETGIPTEEWDDPDFLELNL